MTEDTQRVKRRPNATLLRNTLVLLTSVALILVNLSPRSATGETTDPLTSRSSHLPARLIDLSTASTTVEAVIATLHDNYCSPVSFIPAGGDQTISINLKSARVEVVLREIARQRPTYRFESIKGRNVLYPATPEFQAVIDRITMQGIGRFDAIERYIPILRARVPALADLGMPPEFGNFSLPFFSEPVSLSERARVIDHFVELLGRNQFMFFFVGIAPTGVPVLELSEIKCPPVVPRVQFLPCSAPEASHSSPDILARRIPLDAERQPVSGVLDRLRSEQHIPVSFVESSGDRQISVHLQEVGVRDALEAIVSRAPDYKCLVGNGHVVLTAIDPELESTRSDVRVIKEQRFFAAISFLSELRKLPVFRDLYTYVEPPSEVAFRDEEVSLSSEGSVLEHLVQLLGDNPRAYFSLRYGPLRGRVLSFESLPPDGGSGNPQP